MVMGPGTDAHSGRIYSMNVTIDNPKEEEISSNSDLIQFIVDSGSTSHMCNDKELFHNWTPFNESISVHTSTGGIMLATGRGDILLNHTKTETSQILLQDVLYVPSLAKNLISVTTAITKGYMVRFVGTRCIFEREGKITVADYNKGRYVFNLCKTKALQEHSKATDFDTEDLSCILEEPESWSQIKTMEEEPKNKWIGAMLHEVNNFNNNQTWEMETPPDNVKPISTRWTYKVKKNQNSEVTKIRARLVAKGFEQSYGTQFDESYAPVVKMNTLRLLFTIAADHHFSIRHIDVDSAFLYGKLKEDIYVHPPDSPPGMFVPGSTYKLKAAIYGLKQAAHAWFTRINSSLNILDFKNNQADPCLFVKKKEDQITYIVIHVDDILIISTDPTGIDGIIASLREEYSIKDLGSIMCYLGIHIVRNNDPPYYALSQPDKIKKIIKQANMQNHRPTNTPMLPDHLNDKRNDSSEKFPDVSTYQQILGGLLYLANTTRPDIALAISILSRSSFSPTSVDWMAMKRTIAYLIGTVHLPLILGKVNETSLTVYSDADWGGDPSTKKSTTGTCHFFNGSLVAWTSKRQKCVSLSTSEAEYVSAVEATKDTSWLIQIMEELQIEVCKPVLHHCDNQSMISLASSLKSSGRSKHMDIRLHYIKETIDNGMIMLKYCCTKKMVADILTKPVTLSRFRELLYLLMNYVTPQTNLIDIGNNCK